MPVETRLLAAPYDVAAAAELERELSVSHLTAQVLVRRGHTSPAAAREFLDGKVAHPPESFGGIAEGVLLIADHVGRGSRITVHGDYDVDGVCSTAILVRALRRVGAQVDWYLPSRSEDGYGLSVATTERLAGRGTDLLITVDCGITAVDEVAHARSLGIDVLVTDHHSTRADGRRPGAPIVHPRVGGYPCEDLCAAGVAHVLALALARSLPSTNVAEGEAIDDLDLVALATVADCVPLLGENRRLVREGLLALARTAKPGLRALMRVAQVDPSGLDARAIGFRLAPRINAAGRLDRADAGLELLLTQDETRATAIAAELDRANAQRRDVETRIRFEAEALVSAAGERAAYVLAGEGWHPGVIGIVASRIAERHNRPTVMIALDGDRGTCSGRSIPAFDLLAGLDACAEHLLRHGGHRAAAGATIARSSVEAFSGAFEAHACAVLDPADFVPRTRVDAIAGVGCATMAQVEELERLAPFGIGNPEIQILLSAASLTDPRTMGEGKHLRATVSGAGNSARVVAFGTPRLPVAPDTPADVVVTLERNVYNGVTEAQLMLRSASPVAPLPVVVRGEPENYLLAAVQEFDRALPAADRVSEPVPPPVDRSAEGAVAVLADLVASGEPVLAVCAHVGRRLPGLAQRAGGFQICSWESLERDRAPLGDAVHVVIIDPPALALHSVLLARLHANTATVRAWGDAELRFTEQIHEHEYGLRTPLTELYRALRDRDGAEGEELETVLRGDGAHPRSAALAGRTLRVLSELGLVSLDRDRLAVTVPAAHRTELETSEAYRAYTARLQDARRWLHQATTKAA